MTKVIYVQFENSRLTNWRAGKDSRIQGFWDYKKKGTDLLFFTFNLQIFKDFLYHSSHLRNMLRADDKHRLSKESGVKSLSLTIHIFRIEKSIKPR